MALKAAVGLKIIAENPCDYVVMPKQGYTEVDTKEQITLNDDEIARFK